MCLKSAAYPEMRIKSIYFIFIKKRKKKEKKLRKKEKNFFIGHKGICTRCLNIFYYTNGDLLQGNFAYWIWSPSASVANKHNFERNRIYIEHLLPVGLKSINRTINRVLYIQNKMQLISTAKQLITNFIFLFIFQVRPEIEYSLGVVSADCSSCFAIHRPIRQIV